MKIIKRNGKKIGVKLNKKESKELLEKKPLSEKQKEFFKSLKQIKRTYLADGGVHFEFPKK